MGPAGHHAGRQYSTGASRDGHWSIWNFARDHDCECGVRSCISGSAGQTQALLLAAVAAAVVLQIGKLMPSPVAPADHTALLVQENIPILDGADWTKDYLEGTFAICPRSA